MHKKSTQLFLQVDVNLDRLLYAHAAARFFEDVRRVEAETGRALICGGH
jgi:hypothetical protein